MHVISQVSEETFYETSEELRLKGVQATEKDLLEVFHRFQDGVLFLSSRYTQWWMALKEGDRVDVSAKGRDPLSLVLDRFDLPRYELSRDQMAHNGFLVPALDARDWEQAALNAFWRCFVAGARACPVASGRTAF